MALLSVLAAFAGRAQPAQERWTVERFIKEKPPINEIYFVRTNATSSASHWWGRCHGNRFVFYHTTKEITPGEVRIMRGDVMSFCSDGQAVFQLFHGLPGPTFLDPRDAVFLQRQEEFRVSWFIAMITGVPFGFADGWTWSGKELLYLEDNEVEGTGQVEQNADGTIQCIHFYPEAAGAQPAGHEWRTLYDYTRTFYGGLPGRTVYEEYLRGAKKTSYTIEVKKLVLGQLLPPPAFDWKSFLPPGVSAERVPVITNVPGHAAVVDSNGQVTLVKVQSGPGAEKSRAWEPEWALIGVAVLVLGTAALLGLWLQAGKKRERK